MPRSASLAALLTSIALCGASATAAADAPAAAPAPNKARPRATAGWLSGGTTLGGAGAIVLAGTLIDRNHHGAPEWLLAGGIGAALVGPTLGHAYAGHTWNPWLGLRLGGIAAAVLGTGTSLAEGTHDFSNLGPAIAGILVGGGLYAVGTVGEIVTAPDAVDDDYNRAMAGSRLTLAPVPTSRGVVPGIGLVGRF